MYLKIKHPAVFSDQFLPVFYDIVKNCKSVYDPFAGTGKIALIKELGYTGHIVCNDIESEYSKINNYPVDSWIHDDAEKAIPEIKIDAIVTSPTYGNRMADSHNAKDNSKRITYTHQLGRQLNDCNTGKMQWGSKYQDKHNSCYKHFYSILKKDGLIVVNISNHIRKGVEVPVVDFHYNSLVNSGFVFLKNIDVPVKRMRFGKNSDLRVENEKILIFKK